MSEIPRYFIFPTDIDRGVPPEFRKELTEKLLDNARGGFDVIIDLQERKMFYMGEWKKVKSE